MKTRERILHCALELFNEQGEPTVTTLDMANELDISPGNLYYHFKGKEPIIAELLEHFMATTRGLLLPEEEPDTQEPEDYWLFLHLLFEAIIQYRFLFRDLSSLMGRYDAVEQGMQLWLLALRRRFDQQLVALESDGHLLTDSASRQRLLDSQCQTLVYWLDYCRLGGNSSDAEEEPSQGVIQVLGLILPWLDEPTRDWLQALIERYEQA
ncbi:TetR/AcrR family transcriptional regulator [Halopseudomonas salegens]|uniref:Transcriptional regulator, TetR family n=1 Tax=Halopseudomonas salegens TaxID=1434072 RepID=A0A1H2H818_9GAMM|nr:TetR/AcrR family transcriptional regulator [Halopseudomonas salegens]SDU27956.1 transcriptional regulator, TetR family [Halopseudomonas salegens]